MQQYLYNGSESRQDKKKEKKHQRTKSWLCWMKFKCIKLLLSNWFSKWAVKNSFYSIPISNVVTMVPYSDISQNYCVQQANLKLERWKAQTDAPTLDSVEFLNPVNGKLIWGVHNTSQWV